MTSHIPEHLRKWALNHKTPAEAVCTATAFAQIEHTRVDQYMRPIFHNFNFMDEDGGNIKIPEGLYLEHGFTGTSHLSMTRKFTSDLPSLHPRLSRSRVSRKHRMVHGPRITP